VVAGSPWTEEYQVEYLEMNHRVFDGIDAIVGEQMWNFAAFATTSGSCASAATRKEPSRRPRIRGGMNEPVSSRANGAPPRSGAMALLDLGRTESSEPIRCCAR
jgi:hypothetical protein